MPNATYPVSDSLPPLPYELRFLIACSQTEASQNDIDVIRTFLEASSTPADRLIASADRHGLVPITYKTLKTLAGKNMLDAVRQSSAEALLKGLQSANMQTARRNMLMSAELLRVMKLLNDNGVNALAFKGPTLSQMAYGDITMRQYGDLDVLVRRNDAPSAVAMLQKEGYEEVYRLTPAQSEQWYKNAKDIVLLHPDKMIHLELHWQLSDDDYPVQMGHDAIWSRPQTVAIQGRDVPTFGAETLLIYLCIHGSKHLWERIGWIKDIDLVIRTQPIDWERFASRLDQENYARMVLLGLDLSRRLFRTPLPPSILQQLEGRKRLAKLRAFVTDNWRQHADMFSSTAVMLSLFPTPLMKLRYLKKVILQPSKNEYDAIDLPKGFYWVYYLVRPFLLLKKYLSKT